jgi:hypothetical protein
MPGQTLKVGFLWLIVAIAVLIYGPYVLGGIYAVAALPIFSAVCGPSGNPLMFVREPISYPDYQTFLYGEGCKLSPASGPSTQNPFAAGLGAITPEYRGVHPFFSDDPVSYLFENVAQYWRRAFFEGAMYTADMVTGALQTSVMVRVVFFIGYLLVVFIIVRLLGNAVDHFWRQLRQPKSGSS